MLPMLPLKRAAGYSFGSAHGESERLPPINPRLLWLVAAESQPVSGRHEERIKHAVPRSKSAEALVDPLSTQSPGVRGRPRRGALDHGPARTHLAQRHLIV